MKKTAAWILVLTLALLLCACSSAKEDPNLGVYTGQSGAMGSLSVPVDAAFPGGKAYPGLKNKNFVFVFKELSGEICYNNIAFLWGFL